MIAEPSLIERMIDNKQYMDLCGNAFNQLIIANLLENTITEDYLERLRSCYRIRCETMLASLASNMPDYIHWNEPQGGMYIWLTLPKDWSSIDVLAVAVDHQVAFFPGLYFIHWIRTFLKTPCAFVLPHKM